MKIFKKEEKISYLIIFITELIISLHVNMCGKLYFWNHLRFTFTCIKTANNDILELIKLNTNENIPIWDNICENCKTRY